MLKTKIFVNNNPLEMEMDLDSLLNEAKGNASVQYRVYENKHCVLVVYEVQEDETPPKRGSR